MDIVGSKWWKFDFHTHTPASSDYGNGDNFLTHPNEKEWLTAYINAGIDCVAVTDHNSGARIDLLKIAAEEIYKETGKKIYIFPGVEITASGNVHILGIFDPLKTSNDIAVVVGAAGYTGTLGHNDTVSDKSALDVINEIIRFGGVAIPAHIDGPAGLCTQDARTIDKILDKVHAVEIIFPKEEKEKYPLSRYTNLKKEKPSVVGSDSHHPNQVGRGYTWVKMSIPCIDGLKLALVDGNSSLKRFDELVDNENPNQYSSTLLQSIEITNAKYAGRSNALTIDFNPWMNSIIGGRGSGKSSILEFIRIGMDRSKELFELNLESEIRRTFDSFKKNGSQRNNEGVMLDNTQIICTYKSGNVIYKLIWANNNQLVKINSWDGSNWHEEPGDVRSRFPIKIFSQKQIFELSKNPNSLLRLIDESSNVNFQKWLMAWNKEKAHFTTLRNQHRELQAKLQYKETLQGQLTDIKNKIITIENSSHKDILNNFQNITKKVNHINQYLSNIEKISEDFKNLANTNLNNLDIATFDNSSLAEKEIILELSRVYEVVSKSITGLMNESLIITDTKEKFKAWYSNSNFSGISNDSMMEYTHLSKTFEVQGILNPSQYDDLLKNKQHLEASLYDLNETKNLMNDITNQINYSYQNIITLRKELTKNREQFLKTYIQDNPSIKISIAPLSDQVKLEQEFRFHINKPDTTFTSDIYDSDKECGILWELNTRIKKIGILNDDNDLEEWYKIVANFKNELFNYRNGTVFDTKLSKRFIDHLSSLSPNIWDELVLWFPQDMLSMKFHDGNKFKDVAQGSAGQKASAILSFLLSYGTEPLILDQPEDDLDNRLITNLIVKKLNDNKSNRQIIVITHNPNIVVNGDSEYVIALKGHGQINIAAAGSLQDVDVRKKVCEIMEGGETALKQRYRRMIS